MVEIVNSVGVDLLGLSATVDLANDAIRIEARHSEDTVLTWDLTVEQATLLVNCVAKAARINQ